MLCAQIKVGYVQGMNYVVATAFKTLRYNEELTFWFLIQTFTRLNLIDLYDQHLHKHKLLTFQVESILYQMMPALMKHLADISFDLSIYTVKWFFTLFAIDLPFHYVQQVIDLYQYE